MLFFMKFFISMYLISKINVLYSCSINSTCGCSKKINLLTKIIGGEAVKDSNWNWMVSIRSRTNHICGGSLISSDFVLSAAHCFSSLTSLSNIRITAGSIYLSNVNQERSISKVYIHRNYNPDKYINDIAIVQLSTPFDMSDSLLALICLPNEIFKLRNMTNSDVIAIGWGVTTIEKEKNTPSNVLQQVTLKLINEMQNECQRTIHDQSVQLCAGDRMNAKDTCQGDSGGPLMIYLDDKWYLLGITSYGRSCATLVFAGVYTRVSAYVKQIDCVLKNDTICIDQNFQIRNSMSFSNIYFSTNVSFFLIFLYIFI